MKKHFSFLSFIALLPHSSAATLEDYISQHNPRESREITSAIFESAKKYNIDPLFLASIFSIESKFNPRAISSAGAIGISQIMPDTAKELNVDPYNIRENIDGGSRYFMKMLSYHTDKGIYQFNYALASYNAGYGNCTTQIPSYTYSYISKINSEYNEIRKNIQKNTSSSNLKQTT